MDWKIELVAIPVTDVDRAKEFYVERVGFHPDHDYQVTETLRFVQLTPPGSACSIVMGTGITEMAPGTQKGVQVVVADVEAARRELIGRGVQASDVDVSRGARSLPSVTLTATRGRSSNCRYARRTPMPCHANMRSAACECIPLDPSPGLSAWPIVRLTFGGATRG